MAKRKPTGEDAALTEQLQREALIARARRKLELEAQDAEEQRRAKLPLAIVVRLAVIDFRRLPFESQNEPNELEKVLAM